MMTVNTMSRSQRPTQESRPSLQDWLSDQPFTLALSSGFFGFYAHAGALAALVDAGLSPTRITGSSAGALVGGVYASGTSIEALKTHLFSIKRQRFWDPGLGLGLLRGERFQRELESILTADNFSETRVPLAISAFDVGRLSTLVLDTGQISTAIRASCCFPGLFHPVRRDGRLLIDGGVLDRAGFADTPPRARVLHHFLPSGSSIRRGLAGHGSVSRRAGAMTVQINGLPRIDPFHLERGQLAYEVAFRQMSRALSLQVDEESDLLTLDAET